MPEPTQSLLNDLVSWSSEASMYGAYNCTVTLTNQEDQYDDDIRYTPFEIKLTSEAFGDVVPACYEGTNITWVYGIIHSFDNTIDIIEDGVQLSIKSFFALAGSKPVNTIKYDHELATTILAELAEVYGGIPTALCDFTGLTGTSGIYSVIAGNNLLEEMRKVAQAGRGDVFVRNDGILVAENWKDADTAVDVVIPNEAVIKATRSRAIGVNVPSRIVVRGRFISQFECGSQILSCDDCGLPEPKELKPAQKQGTKKQCSNEGVPKPRTQLKVRGLRGDKNTIRNATYEVVGDNGEFERVDGITEAGGANISITGPGGGMIAAGDNEFEIRVSGPVKPEQEYESPNSTQGPLKGNQDRTDRRMDNMMSGLTFERVLLESPFMPGKSKRDNDRHADEPEPIRIGMVLDDADLQAEYGVITEQIDNLYITDYEGLFEAGVRAFQEGKMARKAWTVQTVYIPCVRLNKVVTFTTPDGAHTITGLVRQLKVDYQAAGPQAQMEFVVESFEDIGATSYTSENLLMYPEFCGSNNIHWVATIPTAEDFVWHLGGYVSMGSNDGLNTVILAQPINLEIGASYTLTVVATKDTGADLTVSVLDAGGVQATTSTSVDGTVTVLFTPDQVANTIQFSTSGNWYLARPRLTKTVTR